MRKLMIVSLASFAVALLVFDLVRDEAGDLAQPQQRAASASPETRIVELERVARARPQDPGPLIELASTLLGLVRQGADTRNYVRADAALADAIKRDPTSAASART